MAATSLTATLAAMREASTSRIPEDIRAILGQANDDLAATGIVEKAIKKGGTLPAFSLTNQDGETVNSAELLAKGPLVISFFRGLWCPYCNAELKALTAAESDIAAKGATLVVISPQTQQAAAKTRAENGLNADILVDSGNDYADVLGIKFALIPAVKEIYSKFGIDLPAANGDDSWTLPVPTRLVVGTDGSVLYSAIDVDYTHRPEPSETVAAIPG